MNNKETCRKVGRLWNSSLILLLIFFLSFNTPAREGKNPVPDKFKQALNLEPDINNGRNAYRFCVACHGPEGWGSNNGSYPQIAGQLPAVTIKQLGDISSDNRRNPIMKVFSSTRVLPTAQDIADLAEYISRLPMTGDNGQGNVRYLALGKQLYNKTCKRCHGESGEGNQEDQIPRIQGQHYNYLKRQFSWIRTGHRYNADDKMIKKIANFTLRDELAVSSYVATLKPPVEHQASEGWSNPDFPNYDRKWSPGSPRRTPLNY